MRKGIIEKIYNSKNSAYKDVISIEGKANEKSNPVSVLFVPDNSFWWSTSLNNTFTISLKEGYGIYLTHFLLRSGDANLPRNWCIEGLVNDIWTIISNNENDTKFDQPFQKKTYNATEGFYTRFRFNQTALNNGHWTFCLSFVDFFGFLSNGKGDYLIAGFRRSYQMSCKQQKHTSLMHYVYILLYSFE